MKGPEVEEKPVLKFLNVGTGLQDSILELEATKDASLRSSKYYVKHVHSK